MKQKLRFILMTLLCAVFSAAWGEETVYKTLTFSSTTNEKGVSSYETSWTATINGFTWNLVNFNNNNNAWNYVKCGRKNNTSVATITTNSIIDKPVTKVVVKIDAITADKVNKTKLEVASDPSFETDLQEIEVKPSAAGDVTYTVTEPTENQYYRLTFDCASGTSNGLVTISKVEYYYNVEVLVPAPTFSPEGGKTLFTTDQDDEDKTITISCEDPDAVIYYTTDGSSPTQNSTQYDSGIVLTKTITIKAIAIKGNDVSAVATAEYKVIDGDDILQDLSILCEKDNNGNYRSDGIYYVDLNGWENREGQGAIVNYVNGNNAYLYDGTGAILLYKSSHGLKAGDVLSDVAEVSFKIFNDLPEITDIKYYQKAENSETPNPIESTFSSWENLEEDGFSGYLSMYLKITGATITQESGNYFIGENNKVQLYGRGNASSISVPDLNDTYTIVGFPTVDKGTKELVIYVQPEAEGTNVVPTINIEKESIEIAYDATSGEIAYTITHPATGKSLQATADAGWISNITVTNEKVTFTTTVNDGEADREANITLTYEGAENAKVKVTQKHYVKDFAELPFEFNDGKAAIEKTTGLTQDGLGTDYNASTAPTSKLKFDGTGDYLILKINERPGKLTFDIKGNGFSGGSFKVQTSEDGLTYTDLKTYTENDEQSEEFENLGENVRYIKWIYTNKSSGNVGLGNIKLAKYSSLTDAELSFEATEYTAIFGKEFTAPTLSNPHNLTVTYSSSNEEVATVDATTGAVTLLAAGETTITATDGIYNLGSAFYKLTVIKPLANIAALSSQTKGGDYKVNFNNVVVTYVNGSYAYMQDASGAIVMYKSEHGLTAGQVLNGTAEVTFQLSYGNPRITSLSDVTKTAGTAPEPTTVAASAWSTPIASVLSQYFKVTGATITKDGSKYYVQLGSEKVQLYGQGAANPVSVDEEYLSKTYTIVGFPTLYNTTLELQIFEQPEADGTNITPSINTESSIELAYNATSGEIAYTINNPTDGKLLQASANADWISNITVTGEKVTFTTTVNDGEADRKATITLTYEGANPFPVEVTQKHYVIDYATLPFAFNSGKADIENKAGLTQEGLGSDYSASTAPNTKLKFDGTGDYLILKINERPGKLTFDIKGNGFSGGSFKVQTSEDGLTYTDLKTYTENDEQSEEFENLGENVRYIKWIYTNKSSGNVGLGNIKLAKNPELSFEKTEYTGILGEVFTTPTLNNPHELSVSYSSSNEEVATVDAATGAVTLLAAGETTITATSEADDNYSSGSASYKLTVTAEAAGIPGDANNDGIVSVADVMLVVNYVLGNDPANFNFKNANVNNDPKITVADVMAIVKIVLGN